MMVSILKLGRYTRWGSACFLWVTWGHQSQNHNSFNGNVFYQIDLGTGHNWLIWFLIKFWQSVFGRFSSLNVSCEKRLAWFSWKARHFVRRASVRKHKKYYSLTKKIFGEKCVLAHCFRLSWYRTSLRKQNCVFTVTVW